MINVFRFCIHIFIEIYFQTRKDIQKALEEDPSVYQYDEIYDEMEQKKVVATQATKTKDKKVIS